jgi:hypothetical protein
VHAGQISATPTGPRGTGQALACVLSLVRVDVPPPKRRAKK